MPVSRFTVTFSNYINISTEKQRINQIDFIGPVDNGLSKSVFDLRKAAINGNKVYIAGTSPGQN